jgi:hypothetical protein
MGLKTTRPGGIGRKEDLSIAKNFLTEDELHVMNRVVSAYLEFAELQALNRKPMTMGEWVTKLDEFLKLAGRELLDHAGKVSAESAKTRAEQEYERYPKRVDAEPRAVDPVFELTAKRLQALPRPKKPGSAKR